MADIIITGIVRSDGLIEVSEKVDLQPGQKVRLLVQPLPPFAELESVTLEEAKIQIEADLKYELTEEERAAYHRAYDKLGALASDNLELPIKIESVTLEEAKKRLPEERELTDEEIAELKRAYDLINIGAENTGLPADYAELGSVALEEAKKQIEADLQYELTEEERAAYHRAYDKLEALASDNLGLPEDAPDELDHYIYGAPRRKPKE